MTEEEVVWVKHHGPALLTMAPEPLHLTRGQAQRGLIRISLPRMTWGALWYAHAERCPVVFAVCGGLPVTPAVLGFRPCNCGGFLFRGA